MYKHGNAGNAWRDQGDFRIQLHFINSSASPRRRCLKTFHPLRAICPRPFPLHANFVCACLSPPAVSVMGNSGSSLQTCLNNVCNGRTACVRYPTDPLYQLAWVKPYNLDIGVTPVAVVRPQTAADISGIVKCASANNVTIQAKSGGHSYG